MKKLSEFSIRIIVIIFTLPISSYGIAVCAISAATINPKLFEEMSEYTSEGLYFSYMYMDFAPKNGDIIITYGFTKTDGKRRFSELTLLGHGGEGSIKPSILGSGFDNAQTSNDEPNILSHRVIEEIFTYSIHSDMCLKKYVDDEGNLNIRSIFFEVRKNIVDLVYLEPNYNTGASAVCSFLLEPIRQIESSRVEM